jgi:hypothetical protein
MFIEHVLDVGSEVLLITRPRRMGKSLNLSMLSYFLDCGQDSRELFKGLRIEESGHFSKINTIPVINMSFRQMEMTDPEGFATLMRDQAEYYLRGDQIRRNLASALDKPEKMAGLILPFMCENLAAAYGVNPFILIDEYDKQIMDNPNSGETLEFVKRILSGALKSNKFLGKAVVVGVNRIAQESMFSDLNNLRVMPVTEESEFDADFGFTEDEAARICPAGDMAEVREWYNNYRVGREKVYFTYSVMSHLENGRFANYWGRSGRLEQIKAFLTVERLHALTEIVNTFGVLHVREELSDRLSMEDLQLFTDDPAFYSLLVQSGYLTFDPADDAAEVRESDLFVCDIYLPNKELQSVWKKFILTSVMKTKGRSVLSALDEIGNPAKFEPEFRNLLANAMSYFDFDKSAPENTYHTFTLGLLAGAGLQCVSNRESARGRYDVCLVLNDKIIIFEFKKAASGIDEDLAAAADTGIEQAVRLNYAGGVPNDFARTYGNIYDASALAGLPAYIVGTGFFGKDCVVRVKRASGK